MKETIARMIITASVLVACCALVSARQEEGPASGRNSHGPRYRVETIDLGTVAHGRDSFGRAINDRQQIAGMVRRTEDDLFDAFIWSPSQGFQTIVESAIANAINNAGEVVGGWFECPGL